MNNKKKICVYMMLMLLGVCNISANSVLAKASKDNQKTQEVQEVQEEKKVEDEVSSKIESKDEDVKVSRDTIDDAADLIAKKDYNSAISLLNAYIEAKPKKYEAYKLRGDSYYAMRQYKLAKDDYQKAIDLKASDDKFLTGTKVLGALVLGADKDEQYQNPELGNLYGRLMYAQKALNSSTYESSYQKALEYNSHIYLPNPDKNEIAKINCPQKYGKLLDPKGVDKYINGAVEDIEKGHYSEAIYKSQYITSNYPDFYLGYYLTGVSLSGMDKFKEAEGAFETALKYNPNDFESLASLGQLYYTEAEKTFDVEASQKSIDYFKSALKLNSNCYLYYYYIGLNYLQMGEYNLAIDNFNSAIKYKANDYNSRYYKLIAQYILGNYSAVIEDTTRLLYRHVSNYNSVLYLRALAEYKQGYFDDALADIEKIHINMNDIYNADVKTLSPKEKTLESYLYYLKAQILTQKGFGAKADFQKAVQNPIIANLAKVEGTVTQYTKHLADDAVSVEDYNKYKKLYDSSIKNLLDKNLVITADDIDNQYDYIRTTFDNLGLTFDYVAPNYRLTTINDYTNKKYGTKFSREEKASTDTIVKDSKTIPTALLKPSTDPSETLANDKSSIALMLASHNLSNNDSSEVNETDLNILTNKESSVQSQIPNTENPVIVQNQTDLPVLRKNIDETIESENQGDKEVSEDKVIEENKNLENKGESEEEPIVIEAPVQKESETFEIIKTSEQEKQIEETSETPVAEQEEIQQSEDIKVEEKEKIESAQDEVPTKFEPSNNQAESEPEVSSAVETKSEKELDSSTTEVIEQKEESVQEEKLINQNSIINSQIEKENSEQEIPNQTEPKIETAPDVKSLPELRDRATESPVLEKQATVNLKDFNTEPKQILQLPEGDEVVLFEPTNFLSEAEKMVSPAKIGFQNPNVVTDNFAAARMKADMLQQEKVNNKQHKLQKDAKVSTPSVLVAETSSKKVEETQNTQLTAQKEETLDIVNEKSDEPVLEEVNKEEIIENLPDKNVSTVEVSVNNGSENPDEVINNASENLSEEVKKEGNWFTSLFKKKSTQNDNSEKVIKTEAENENLAETEILESEEPIQKDEIKEEEIPQTAAEETISSIVKTTFFGNSISDTQKDVSVNSSQVENINLDTPEENQIESVENIQENIENLENANESSKEVKAPWYKRIFKKKTKVAENENKESVENSENEETTDNTVNLDENIETQESSVQKNEESSEQQESISDNVEEIVSEAPQIRGEKAEVAESEVEVLEKVSDNEIKQETATQVKEKKKFTWWWQKNKDKKSEIKKEKSKFSFKNMFSKNKNTQKEQTELPVKERKVIKELQKHED